MDTQIKTTCLHPRHLALGAQMSPFAGFDMPIQYSGIVEEHQAVRNACGVFDVSHMGEVIVEGEEATAFVNHVFTNDVAPAAAGQCLYGMMLHEHGGVVDDLLVYKFSDTRYLLVINAGNIDKDVAWLSARLHGDVNPATGRAFKATMEHVSDAVGELAVQGPKAEEVIERVLGLKVADLAFYTFKEIALGDGRKILVSRTGYTGEDGFEIYADCRLTDSYWQQLVESGEAVPCGLGCRDTLRFEVGLPLYGDELTDEITPLEAGLGMFVKFDKGEFVGREALLAQKEKGVGRKLVGLELSDRAIPRHGYEVLDMDGNKVGEVTTGYHAISVDKSIAMALVDVAFAAKDTPLQVQIRRKRFPCVVVAKKFYKKSYKK